MTFEVRQRTRRARIRPAAVHRPPEIVARQVGMDPARVFKTLVARGEKRGVLVACVPVDRELDCKALAQAAGEKKVELAHVSELVALTGYQRGGCSPVGMKKPYPVWIDESCLSFITIAVSAGTRGCQLLLAPGALIAYTRAQTARLTKEEK